MGGEERTLPCCQSCVLGHLVRCGAAGVSGWSCTAPLTRPCIGVCSRQPVEADELPPCGR
jgi:hypothetical protein